jgi:hypothetical protein
MIFSASYDTPVKIVTPITFLVLILSFITPAITGAAVSVYYFLIPLIIIVTLACIAYAPKYYCVEAGKIKIYRILLKPVTIKIDTISGIEILTKAQLKGSIRLWGSGAFLGYFGWFTTKKLGKAMWYATRMDRTIFIYTNDGKKFLISPDNADLFLDQLPGIV